MTVLHLYLEMGKARKNNVAVSYNLNYDQRSFISKNKRQ